MFGFIFDCREIGFGNGLHGLVHNGYNAGLVAGLHFFTLK